VLGYKLFLLILKISWLHAVGRMLFFVFQINVSYVNQKTSFKWIRTTCYWTDGTWNCCRAVSPQT